jgi:hypothetical protein
MSALSRVLPSGSITQAPRTSADVGEGTAASPPRGSPTHPGKSVNRALPDGLYELVTEELDAALSTVDALRHRAFESLTDVDAPAAVARHLGREIERFLGVLPQERRAEAPAIRA